jgi:hypothetical protein
MTTPRDQPDQVVTEDTARAPDEHVVTSDANFNPDSSPADPVPSAAADKDGPITSDSDTGKPKPTPPKRNRPAERRIRKLTDKLATAEAKDAANAQEIAELRDQVKTLTDATPKPKEPKLNDFDNPREYAQAYAKWEAGTEEPAPKPTRRAAPKPKPDAPAAPQKPLPQDAEILSFQERGKKKLGDEFIEALGEKTAVNQLMGEFMLDHDVGPEMYVHLANNPEEARKIYDSSVPRQIKAMEALAAKGAKGGLDAGQEGELQVAPAPANPADDDYEDPGHEPPKVTTAPEPPSDTTTTGDADVPVNPESESMDDYAARRAKEEARRAGRLI